VGRSHPQPEQAARYSESGFIGQPNGIDPETERAQHARFRRVLSRSFSARRMQALRPRVTELASGLLDELGKQVPPVDFHERVSYPLPVLVICELLGVPYEDRDEFRVYSDQIADMTDQATSRAGMQGLFTYMTALVKRKRTKPGVDVISDLILAQETETFPADGIASAAAGMLFAGHITTVNAIDRGVLLLCTNTEQRTALAADPGLVDRAVEEILRMPTPLPNPSRPVPVGPTRYAHADIHRRSHDRRRRPGAAQRPSRQLRPSSVHPPRAIRHHPHGQPAPDLRPRGALLPRRAAGPHRAAGTVQNAARAVPNTATNGADRAAANQNQPDLRRPDRAASDVVSPHMPTQQRRYRATPHIYLGLHLRSDEPR
jgi:hypothetical protein